MAMRATETSSPQGVPTVLWLVFTDTPNTPKDNLLHDYLEYIHFSAQWPHLVSKCFKKVSVHQVEN